MQPLGFFADILVRLALHQRQRFPEIRQPRLLIFAGDHGIAQEGYPAPPDQRTSQQVLDLLHAQASLHHVPAPRDFSLKIIDAGIDFAFESNFTYWLHHGTRLINGRIARGTENLVDYPAMNTAHTEAALDLGRKIVQREAHHGSNFIALSGLGWAGGIAQLSLTAAFLEQDPRDLVLDAEPWYYQSAQDAAQLVRRVLRSHPKTQEPITLLSLFGSYEIAALLGALLEGASQRISLLIDNSAAATALLLAQALHPEVMHYSIFSQRGALAFHGFIQDHLQAQPILNSPTESAPGINSTWALLHLEAQLEQWHRPPHREESF